MKYLNEGDRVLFYEEFTGEENTGVITRVFNLNYFFYYDIKIDKGQNEWIIETLSTPETDIVKKI